MTITLPVWPRSLVDDVLRHAPPTPAELERAIDVIEDALTDSPLARSGRGNLLTADALLQALPGLETPGMRLTRDAVEALFQRLASRSLGMPVPTAALPAGRNVVAALVILRECMHRLGFDVVAMISA
ncbi:hypothetical protein [Methylibium sp.]|uniref:hypothetical protein n=1 Tax=Methylibium sp. TaxID=2067992 RepID=UPI003D0B7416